VQFNLEGIIFENNISKPHTQFTMRDLDVTLVKNSEMIPPRQVKLVQIDNTFSLQTGFGNSSLKIFCCRNTCPE